MHSHINVSIVLHLFIPYKEFITEKNMNFERKAVLVTGASSGIGASIALEFTKHGANVAIVGRNRNKLSDVARTCEDNGKKPLMLLADVTKDAEIKRIVDETMNKYGRLDILVNNAGVSGFGSILSEDALELFDRMMAINLRAAVCLAHFAGPHLIKTGGNIIIISSIGSTVSLLPKNFSYCTSKAGLDHFARSIALELASKGVRVNCVNPGPVKTDCLNALNMDTNEQEKFWDNCIKVSPLGKVSEPNEIADLVLYLASDKAKSVTGGSFAVDNGVLLKGYLLD